MSDIPFDAVGFDLDGTLLDTFRDLGAAVNHALELGGFDPVPVGSSKDLIGGGAKIMLAKAVENQGGMPEDDFRALYKKMLAYYSANNAVHTVPYPHVSEVLGELRERGIKMAVVTNKFEEFAGDILTQLGLVDYFERVSPSLHPIRSLQLKRFVVADRSRLLAIRPMMSRQPARPAYRLLPQPMAIVIGYRMNWVQTQ
jgi:hypothetical protein